jgi:hypothetical protein
MSWRRHLATLLLFAALAVVHTWPLAQAPGKWSRIDNADFELNAWILAWVVHQAPRDPVHLFDANIFYPEPRTLAFSEHLVPQALLAAPVIWSGGSAVLACNITILLGYVLGGWAMTLVITRWTGDWLAGLVAGSLLAFNAHTMARFNHVQAQHNYYLPLGLLMLDRVFVDRRWRDATSCGLLMALQALTSGYWLAFTSVAGAMAVLARAGEWWPFVRTRPARSIDRWRPIALLGTVVLVASVVLTPFLVPYWQARQYQGLVRQYSEVEHYSGSMFAYLKTGGRLHMLTPLRSAYAPGRGRDALFPGVAGLTLTLGALVTGLAWRDRRARMLLAIGAGGFLLSFGAHLPLYRWLYAIPLLQGLRAPSRFGFLVLVAVAGLSGFALASVRLRLSTPRVAPRRALAVGIALLAIVNIEAFKAPIPYVRFEGFSPVYRIVAQLPNAVIAEFPLYGSGVFKNGDYVLASTVHWKPLVNGYSGYTPDSYRTIATEMRSFPDPKAMAILRGRGVTHVIVHGDRFGKNRDRLLAEIGASRDLQFVAGNEQVRLYCLLPR